MKKKYPVSRCIRKTPVNRADLLRCYTLMKEEDLDAIASLTGFIKKETQQVPEKEHTKLPEVQVDTKKHTTEMTREQQDRLTFFRVTGYRKKREDETESSAPGWYNAAIPQTIEQLRPDPGAVPPAGPPLVPWSRLWPFLRQAMGESRDSPDLDLAMVVHLIASCVPFLKLPFFKRKAWASHCQVIFDFDHRLIPYRRDLVLLYQGIQRLRGLPGLHALLMTEGPLGRVRDAGKWEAPLRSYHLPPPGTPVLIISDLGCLDPGKVQVSAWLAFGKNLKQAGFSPVVLTPCPPRLLEPGLFSLYRIVTWDRGKKIAPGKRPYPRMPGGKKKQPGKSSGAEKLLALLSVAVRVEPPLLRSLRFLLPWKEADAGTEAEVWHHPHTNASSQCVSLINEVREQYRAVLKTDAYKPLYQKVEKLFRDYHSHLSPAIRNEEAMLTALVTRSGTAEWKAFIQSCIKTLGYEGFQYQESLKAWWKRVFSRLPDDVWKDNDELGAVRVMVYKEEILRSQATTLPPGLDLNRYRWIFESTMESREFFSREQGDRIIITTKQSVDGICTAPILSAALSSPLLRVRHITGEQEKSFSMNLQQGDAAFFEKQDTKALVMDTSAWETVMEPFSRPPWAAVMGRDDYGLFCGCKVRDVFFRLRWINPGEFFMGSPEDEPGRNDDELLHKVVLTQGYWIGETTCTQELWLAVMGKNPSHCRSDKMLPVDSVNWNDCMDFIEKINVLLPGLHLCLPSEAEWEYACRAGTRTAFYTGDTITPEQANFNPSEFRMPLSKRNFKYKGTGKTVTIKTFPCNPWGLYEMHGNIWEWCADLYAVFNGETGTDPAGALKGKDHVLRGGGWADYSTGIRSGSRAFLTRTKKTTYTGFRFARKMDKRTEYITIHIRPLPSHTCPPWATEAGEDQYGRFAVCKVKDTAFRMRRINPGEFMMGSPKEEPERDNDEILHKVILTKGFWMAETACTQELWEAVMGNNPSYFKGEHLPVETVSWEECKEFIQKINGIIPGLAIRFPTEAEWEYACRAGTTTPFHFGNNITTDQVNYHGHYPYNNGKKGEYREKTVEVYALPCNDWGLYQMHGNVWEWCEDRYGDYDTKTAIDPRGPNTGVIRVLRGGGWGYYARGARSACRGRDWPSVRSRDGGFRLARGH